MSFSTAHSPSARQPARSGVIAMPSAPPPRMHVCGPFAAVNVGPCLVTAFGGPLSSEIMLELDALTREVHEEHGLVYLLALVKVDTPYLSEAERAAVTNYYQEHAPHFAAVAQVAEGDGLWAVTARTVMKAMGLLTNQPHPLQVHASAEGAAEWLAECAVQLHGRAPTRTRLDLMRAFQAAREALPSPRTRGGVVHELFAR